MAWEVTKLVGRPQCYCDSTLLSSTTHFTCWSHRTAVQIIAQLKMHGWSWRNSQISSLYVASSSLLGMRRGRSSPKSGSKPLSSASPLVGSWGCLGTVGCAEPVHVSMPCTQELCCVGGQHRTSEKHPCTNEHFKYSVIKHFSSIAIEHTELS